MREPMSPHDVTDRGSITVILCAVAAVVAAMLLNGCAAFKSYPQTMGTHICEGIHATCIIDQDCCSGHCQDNGTQFSTCSAF
jgi:hypothetical protein